MSERTMKCEHEGCEAEATAAVHVDHRNVDFGWFAGARSKAVCEKHLPDLLRERADEVEGVKVCAECHGAGHWVRGDIIDGYEHFECPACRGTGRVKR